MPRAVVLILDSFDIGQTLAEGFGLPAFADGRSFLPRPSRKGAASA